MIITGYAMEQGDKDFRLLHLHRGIEKIRAYPTLHSILGEFSDFDIQNYDHNPFLNLASKAMYDFWKDGPNELAKSQLDKLEELMSGLFERHPDSDDRGKLTSDMESFDMGQSQRKFTELKVLLELKVNESIDDILYEVIPDSSHDFRITSGDIEFNIELSSLGETESNRLIRESFNEVSMELLPMLANNKILNIQIAVDKIRMDNGAIDKNYIKTLLLEKIRRVFPIVISDESTWNIEPSIIQCEGNLLENIHIVGCYGRWGDRLQRLMSDDDGHEILRNINTNEFRDFPLTYFIYGSGRFKLIEIQTQSFYPSDAAVTRIDEVLSQLIRRITRKLKRRQLRGQTNPILAIQFSDTYFEGYGDEVQTVPTPGSFDNQKDVITTSFNTVNWTNVLGVILFENDIQHSRFLANPNQEIGQQVLNKINDILPNSIRE